MIELSMLIEELSKLGVQIKPSQAFCENYPYLFVTVDNTEFMISHQKNFVITNENGQLVNICPTELDVRITFASICKKLHFEPSHACQKMKQNITIRHL
jgi:hypothetical protein